jgi:hypothetical protein
MKLLNSIEVETSDTYFIWYRKYFKFALMDLTKTYCSFKNVSYNTIKIF